ncbi:MAG: SPOR domain-containing protein [Cytophagales bacterium]|nr:SPOR domain-containing protein [Bernardetiaceae bacterium]MDW8210035.1 SPOR domain-containing protein [Cytophagales bacterium]
MAKLTLPGSIAWPILYIVLLASAQAQTKDFIYTLERLSQEPIKITKKPVPDMPKMSGDTTFTIFKNASVSIVHYFVEGEQYTPLFNPNPTGVYLNNQHFLYFCDVEKSFRQSVSNYLDVYEFTYLGRNYLNIVSLREDCGGKACNYRCYNLFDITNPKAITQVSFSSIFHGSESYGDFNMDGQMDFVRLIPKLPENAPKGTKLTGETYLITAYTVNGSKAVQLRNEQSMPHYIFARGDTEGKQFKVLFHDWMLPLKDSTGTVAKPVSYFQPYVPFDPRDSQLYDIKGNKVEKNKWSLVVKKFRDLEGAQAFCEELVTHKFENIFILTDQYGKDISFLVLVGNYLTKEQAQTDAERLKGMGFPPSLHDLKTAYYTR